MLASTIWRNWLRASPSGERSGEQHREAGARFLADETRRDEAWLVVRQERHRVAGAGVERLLDPREGREIGAPVIGRGRGEEEACLVVGDGEDRRVLAAAEVAREGPVGGAELVVELLELLVVGGGLAETEVGLIVVSGDVAHDREQVDEVRDRVELIGEELHRAIGLVRGDGERLADLRGDAIAHDPVGGEAEPRARPASDAAMREVRRHGRRAIARRARRAGDPSSGSDRRA